MKTRIYSRVISTVYKVTGSLNDLTKASSLDMRRRPFAFDRRSEGEKMGEMKTVKGVGPRVLPIVLYEGQQYFADLRLNEFRPVRGFESIAFNSEDGQIICRHTGVVICQSCRMSAIISSYNLQEPLRCMRCFSSELIS